MNFNSENKKMIFEIMKKNDGYLTSKEVTANGISREYINILVKEGQLEKVARGVYYDKTSPNLDDPFLVFQLKHPNIVFSHFTALSFHDMTEEIPYVPEITIIRGNYRKDFKEYQVFYVKGEAMLNLGKTKIKNNYGHYVNAYDVERCICDIIKSINREDMEQVKKVLKWYANKLDYMKLTEYAHTMGITNKVNDYVGRYVA